MNRYLNVLADCLGNPRRRLIGVAFSTLLATALPVAAGEQVTDTDPALRERIAAMKSHPRGPFARIRWFCRDGSVLPPEPFACKPFGGGSQHGEWTDEVKALRSQGYLVANILSDLDADALLARPEGAWEIGQILIERFLVERDDGWILRQARFYRGALQAEGESRGARRLLQAMLAKPDWVGWRFALLRQAARWLEHGVETASTTAVRQESAALAGEDAGFMKLRNKIHVQPGYADAAAVREYAAGVDDTALRERFADLASLIETVYAPGQLATAIDALLARGGLPGGLEGGLRGARSLLAGDVGDPMRFTLTADLLLAVRDALPQVDSVSTRLRLVDASLLFESVHYAAAAGLASALEGASRADRLQYLGASIRAIYGAGLVSARQREALLARIAALGEAPDVQAFKAAMDYLSLLPGWSAQTLNLHFGPAIERYMALEPLTVLFTQDLLRGSAAFPYTALLEPLARDANRLAGVTSELFGEQVGGLRGLNAGLARGVLHFALEPGSAFDSDGIYVLAETVSDLPPVAGIITAGEGNPLSHVQLLARNLGIPNVAMDRAMIERLRPFENREVLLAVSPGGSVRLAQFDPAAQALFAAEQAQAPTLIRPDLDKLDLRERAPQSLAALRAEDSGRIVGPKAAKLGELKHHYPEAVAEGVAIPFGVFRDLLDQPAADGRPMFEWMRAEYRRLGAIDDAPDRAAQTEAFRRQLYEWIAGSQPDPEVAGALREALLATLGPDGSFGVFVRSDTNVEDLPGFTGAGLNLTVPNVVGIDNILAAIPRVWASPFTARAFAWRQSHMDAPEHVYPAVLLLESVPAEKSGVLVTQHIDTGEDGWLSIAVNEGVGGAVDGQAAESLRVEMATGRVVLLAQASAPVRRLVDPAGGVSKAPVSGTSAVLKPAEITRLIAFARELPERFPAIVDADGQPAPADVEFGFLGGELKLFQIRPFLESAQARGSAYLQSLDAAIEAAHGSVLLSEVPGT